MSSGPKKKKEREGNGDTLTEYIIFNKLYHLEIQSVFLNASTILEVIYAFWRSWGARPSCVLYWLETDGLQCPVTNEQQACQLL